MKHIFLILILFFSSSITAMDQSVPELLPKDIWTIIFAYLDFKTKHSLMRTCTSFNKEYKQKILNKNYVSKDLGLTFNEFINGLFYFKNKNNSLSYLCRNSLPIHKNELLIYFKEKQYKGVDTVASDLFLSQCKKMLDQDSSAGVKFYLPYHVVISCINSLKKLIVNKNSDDESINAVASFLEKSNESQKKMLKEICTFFEVECITTSMIAIMSQLQAESITDIEDCLSDALKQGCFPAIVLFMSYMGEYKSIKSETKANRLYWARNHQERLLLARTECDFFNKNPLGSAIINKELDLVKSLISIIVQSGQTRCLSERNEYMKTPLVMALEFDSDDILKELIAAGAYLLLGEHTVQKQSFFTQANIQRLIACGYDINGLVVCDKKSSNFLHQAITQDNQGLATWLLKNGAKIDILSINEAIAKNQIDVIKLMLAQDKSCFNVDHLCRVVRGQNIEITKMLLATGIDINEKNHENHNPIYCCPSHNVKNKNILEILFNAGANIYDIIYFMEKVVIQCIDEKSIINSLNYNKETNKGCYQSNYLLHCAVEESKYELVKTLILYGADVKRELDNACDKPKILKILFDAGANVLDVYFWNQKKIVENIGEECTIKSLENNEEINKTKEEYITKLNDLLAIAIEQKKLKLIKKLLSYGASANENLNDACDKPEILKILFNAGANILDVYSWNQKKIVENTDESTIVSSLKQNYEVNKNKKEALNELFLLSINLKKQIVAQASVVSGANINACLYQLGILCSLEDQKKSLFAYARKNGINTILKKDSLFFNRRIASIKNNKPVSIKKLNNINSTTYDGSLLDFKREIWIINLLRMDGFVSKIDNNKKYRLSRSKKFIGVDNKIDQIQKAIKNNIQANKEHEWYYQSFANKNINNDIHYAYSRNITKQRMLLLNRE
ncbi:MAG TPA: F-box protein [Candidatus Babeliales bacterium]|nr:F-box protein [Candidatus Babeliales bacterium]